MELIDELKIEYRRLKRNSEQLAEGWEEHVGRDLVASLRNWVQLATEIDSYANSQDWTLKFPVHSKSRAEKTAMKDGGEAVYAPEPIKSGGMLVAQVNIYNRKLTQEEVAGIAAIGPNNSASNSSFVSWLNTESYEIREDSKRVGTSRKLFVERCANMLGGTHPASTYLPERNEQVFDERINELLNTKIGDIPLPWSAILDTANGIVDAFEPYLCDK